MRLYISDDFRLFFLSDGPSRHDNMPRLSAGLFNLYRRVCDAGVDPVRSTVGEGRSTAPLAARLIARKMYFFESSLDRFSCCIILGMLLT